MSKLPRKASVVDLSLALWSLAVPLGLGERLLSGDGDPARHLMIGHYVLAHGPRFADPFSFSRPGAPYLAYEWLSQVVYALAETLGGLPAVAVCAGLLIAGAITLVVGFVRRGGDPWLAFVTGAIVAVLSSPHWLARPHLFSFLGLALLLHVIGWEGRRRLLALAILFAFWANLHPGFLYGLAILCVWAAGNGLDELRRGVHRNVAAMRAAGVVAVPLLASMANPFGWALHAHAIRWVMSYTTGITHEFSPLVIADTYGIFFLLVCGMVVAGFAGSNWVGWRVLLVFWAAFIAALAGLRNAPLMAFFALPLSAYALTPVVQGLPHRVFGAMRAEFKRSDGRSRWASGVALVVLAIMLLVNGRGFVPEFLPRSFSSDFFPTEAVRRAREVRLQGRLFSEYAWGGYILREWPGQQLFVDSMADFFGDELIQEYLLLHEAQPGWQKRLQDRRFGVVLVRPEAPLVSALRAAGGWRVIYQDSVAVLLASNAVGT